MCSQYESKAIESPILPAAVIQEILPRVSVSLYVIFLKTPGVFENAKVNGLEIMFVVNLAMNGGVKYAAIF